MGRVITVSIALGDIGSEFPPADVGVLGASPGPLEGWKFSRCSLPPQPLSSPVSSAGPAI